MLGGVSAVGLLLAVLWAAGGPVVDERLAPAWEALGAIVGREGAPVGEMYRQAAAGTVATIEVWRLPLSHGGGWEPAGRRIGIAEHLLGEDPRLLAAMLVHEITHAEQEREWRERPELFGLGCLEREVGAHQAEARVWWLAWPDGSMPRRTLAEWHLTYLAELELAEPGAAIERWVRSQAGYRRACGLPVQSVVGHGALRSADVVFAGAWGAGPRRRPTP